MTEEQLKTLMLRSLDGDRAAYRDLLAALAIDLRTFFRNRMASAEEAEDLVQETLLAIHLKLETYDPTQPVARWILAIARHKWLDWLRRQSHARVVSLEEGGELAAQEDVERQLAQRDLATLLRELPDKQAAAIQCMKVEGLSASETARRTRQSVAAVKVGVHRGLKRLLARFGSLKQ